MNHFLTLLMVVFLYSSIFSQAAMISGKIISEKTGDPVAYAIITNEEKTVGVYADSAGIFNLKLPQKENFLFVSAVGYETKKIKNADKGNIVIELKENVYALNEIIVSPKNIQAVEFSPKKKISGYLRSCSGFTFQAGIYIKNENNWRGNLSAVRFFISKEGSPNAPFRVRIYQVDAKGSPLVDLLTENVLASGKKGNEWITVDLNKYNIAIPPNGFFVAMEWIKTSNEYSYSHTTKYNTKEVSYPCYGPCLALVNEPTLIALTKSNEGIWAESFRTISVQKDVTKNNVPLIGVKLELIQ